METTQMTNPSYKLVPVEPTEAVTIPRAALDWLMGEGPDPAGLGFGDFPDDHPKPGGAFWWRRTFRDICQHYGYHLIPAPTNAHAEPVAWFHVPTSAVVDPLARDLLVSRFTKELGRDVSSEFEPLHRPSLAPHPASGETEPVAWRWRYTPAGVDVAEWDWHLSEHPMSNVPQRDGAAGIEAEPLYAVSPSPVPAVREALELHQIWLRSALDCKDWYWDSDQRQAAEEAYAQGRTALQSQPDTGSEGKP